ncbi:MAG: flagellar hook-basal body complex protein FliE [Acidaminococcales bacterium]|jgi:flagellar hook-basal body complex protein FliE|nr:flagellar hook-basal body complex protein FliE [Acidaminococcales bacterium]
MKINGLFAPVSGVGNLFEPVSRPDEESAPSFSDMLRAAVNEVNGLQKAAEAKNLDLVAGRVEDLSEVMIAAEKAALALQLTVQVRNKVVDAYQEIMRMSI